MLEEEQILVDRLHLRFKSLQVKLDTLEACRIYMIRKTRNQAEICKNLSPSSSFSRNELFKELASILSFFATDSQSLAENPILQSRPRVTSAPCCGLDPSQKHAR